MHGTSRTTDGGAPIAGGGIVTDVKFRDSKMVGGHIGYRLDPALSVFISYQHSWSDVSWNANFPVYAVSSAFEGSAISDAAMANLAYDIPLSGRTAVRVSAGAGLSFNRLSGIAETDKGTGIFLSDVADHVRVAPIAQAGIGLRHKIVPHVALGLDGSFSYAGGFRTGDSRNGNLGITDINPYRIGHIWRKNIGLSATFDF